jgi:uncharacterized protein YndB with AHSA1/START domain
MLEVTTPSDCEVRLTRVFKAPRELVFRAHTEPALMKRWLGVFGGMTLEVCAVDLRVGGTMRYVWRTASGRLMGMTSTILELEPPERIVGSEAFDVSPSKSISTLLMKEENGITTLTNTILYESQARRDEMLKTGMTRGVEASYDGLERILDAF